MLHNQLHCSLQEVLLINRGDVLYSRWGNKGYPLLQPHTFYFHIQNDPVLCVPDLFHKQVQTRGSAYDPSVCGSGRPGRLWPFFMYYCSGSMLWVKCEVKDKVVTVTEAEEWGLFAAESRAIGDLSKQWITTIISTHVSCSAVMSGIVTHTY